MNSFDSFPPFPKCLDNIEYFEVDPNKIEDDFTDEDEDNLKYYREIVNKLEIKKRNSNFRDCISRYNKSLRELSNSNDINHYQDHNKLSFDIVKYTLSKVPEDKLDKYIVCIYNRAYFFESKSEAFETHLKIQNECYSNGTDLYVHPLFLNKEIKK